ncbi:hypothetical protein C1752_03802 [Acaryochloris thomasi RCC1774]|uniref:Antitoxin n=1 Tax=Acaryochloris thomasi RCC1774 TaxID=1764569 RepID=A0A2W1JFI4_9CYAN|nr:type II toxin-antitoxin system prevent-host-death family antitoxin [Acaryochloris thomasi]PZD72216.1 hypothetical protein C1752_03802 [Acaryochloris thomasi RCC1774]
MQSFSSREFNQDVDKAERAAKHGPVFITDEGIPTHVLLTIDEYHRLSETGKSLSEVLAMPPELAEELAKIEFNPVRSRDVELRDVDLS